ncbi:MAG: AAA family ATPase [Nitrospirota bacterium]
MIEKLSIERFKSIKSLSIPCRKVNVFIGAPDTGKTNILEALGFLSGLGWGWSLGPSLRLRPELGFDPLFYRQFFDQPFQISMHLGAPPAAHQAQQVALKAAIAGGPDRRLKISFPSYGSPTVNFGGFCHIPALDWIRFYSYTTSQDWQYNSGYHLGTKAITPPHGPNLLYIARHNARVYEFLKDTVAGLNWKLRFDQAQRTFRLSEVRQDEILDYNLDLLSDSLKRQFFYGAILQSSEEVTLVFDEPDVFAFPPYPKALGEMIGADRSNQFFLTTHNPYFLTGIVEKTPAEDLAIFVCYRDKEGGTGAKLLTQEDTAKVVVLGASVFFNLDDFIGS